MFGIVHYMFFRSSMRARRMVVTISLAELVFIALVFARLPAVALPAWVGVMTFFFFADDGSFLDALMLGGAAAIGVYALGTILLALSSWPFRALIIALFALPAGLAGYHVVADLVTMLGSHRPMIWAAVGAAIYFMLAARGLAASAEALGNVRAAAEGAWKSRSLSKAR